MGGWENHFRLVICHYYCRSVAPVSSSVFFLSFSQYLQQSGPNGARQMGFSRHFDHEVAASQYIESVLFSSSEFEENLTTFQTSSRLFQVNENVNLLQKQNIFKELNYDWYQRKWYKKSRENEKNLKKSEARWIAAQIRKNQRKWRVHKCVKKKLSKQNDSSLLGCSVNLIWSKNCDFLLLQKQTYRLTAGFLSK